MTTQRRLEQVVLAKLAMSTANNHYQHCVNELTDLDLILPTLVRVDGRPFMVQTMVHLGSTKTVEITELVEA